jgi:putative ABC transport system permease protein
VFAGVNASRTRERPLERWDVRTCSDTTTVMRLLPFDYAVRNLGRSKLRLAAAVGGSALVVLLVLAAGGFVRGMQLSLMATGLSGERIILLSTGSEESIERSEMTSGIDRVIAASIPGIRSRMGVEYVSPEVHAALPVRESRAAEREMRAPMRGVTASAVLVHSEIEMVEGRPPTPGMDEIMIGGLVPAQLGLPSSRLAPGQTLFFGGREWTITGRFRAPNTIMDGEIWAPLTDLQIATRRNTISCVYVLPDTATYSDFAAFAATRLDLELIALRESEYYRSVADFYRPVRLMIWTTAGLIALGAVFGGLNTMYAAFAARIRELGMLQTIGFTRGSIVVSLVQESLLASAAGAIIACVAGVLLLSGVAVTFSMGAFALVVDPPVLAAGLLAGLGVGVVGALPPAWRCLRGSIPEALKAY